VNTPVSLESSAPRQGAFAWFAATASSQPG
jgi:hypothetical protein